MGNTIQQLFEAEDKIKELHGKTPDDKQQRLFDAIIETMHQKDIQNLLNRLWQEINDVCIELSIERSKI